MYLHTRSGRTNNSFVCSNNTQSMPICFFFFYNFIHRRYHQLSLSLSSLVNNKGTFLLILVIISVILTLLIDTKRYLKIYSLNIILVKSLYARDEC